LTLTLSEIEAEVKKMDEESKALKKDIFKLAWFMRGALSIEEAYSMEVMDRLIIGEIIKDNLEITKESGMAFF
jgi:hypothetical protein